MRLPVLDQRVGKGETFGALLAGKGLTCKKYQIIMRLLVLHQRVGKGETFGALLLGKGLLVRNLLK